MVCLGAYDGVVGSPVFVVCIDVAAEDGPSTLALCDRRLCYMEGRLDLLLGGTVDCRDRAFVSQQFELCVVGL